MSTVSPDTSLTLFEAMKQKHVTFIDAPVSGDSNAAKRASLVILAAGPKETVESLHELFSAMGKALYYFGENGNGSRAKLVINLMLGLTMQAIAEALVLAEKFSLDRGTILHMMQQTAVASPFLEFKKELLLKEEFPIAFALKHMQKDLGLILEQAQKTGGVLPATSAVFQTYTAARNHGMGDLDLSAVFQELLRQSGIEK
jgi:3-hydroxyisobutyrate dehydrogenase-like beta-hydroxyacid dehydrogenase